MTAYSTSHCTNELGIRLALDAETFLVVPLVLLGVAALAAWVPARRATRIDPELALRSAG